MMWRFSFEGGPFDGFRASVESAYLKDSEQPPGEVHLERSDTPGAVADLYWPGTTPPPTAERYLRISAKHPEALYRWAELAGLGPGSLGAERERELVTA